MTRETHGAKVEKEVSKDFWNSSAIVATEGEIVSTRVISNLASQFFAINIRSTHNRGSS